MMFWGTMVDLMDGNGGVNNFGSNSLLVDDWLNILMDVVVDTFSLDSRCNRLRLLGVKDRGSILELRGLFLKPTLNLIVVAMIEFLLLNRGHLMVVFLGTNFTVMDWLNSCVVVILVDFLVDGLLDCR
jgi:hypothetical protein